MMSRTSRHCVSLATKPRLPLSRQRGLAEPEPGACAAWCDLQSRVDVWSSPFLGFPSIRSEMTIIVIWWAGRGGAGRNRTTFYLGHHLPSHAHIFLRF